LENSHAQELLCPPVLVENIIGIFAQFLHVGSNEHLTELDKVTVVLVINLDYTPRVNTTADNAAIGSLDRLIRTNYSKRNLACYFFGLGDSFLVLVLICGRLEYLDVVVSNVRENL
jgi:hypothetical protein